MPERLLSSTWFLVGAAALALAWLLPNHYPPWMAFHTEAWSALVLALVSLGVALRARAAVHLSPVALVIAGVALVPLLQLAFGQIVYLGTAWMCALYLAGLALAVQVGAYWQARADDEAVNFIFAAVTGAAAISALLQLYQLAQCEFAGIWVMRVPGQTRFFGNLAQPNQLGTLHLIGALGCGWAYQKKVLPGLVATALCGLILLGLALTGSRTAYINVLLMVLLALVIYRQPQARKVRWTVAGLAAWFVLCVVAVPMLETWFDASESTRQMRIAVSASEPRWMIWKMFLAASLQHPWVGWGWGQIPMANFSVAAQFPDGMGQFNASHNLVLDGIIWVGYPLTLGLLGLAAWWAVRLYRRPLDAEVMYRIGFVAVMLVHAMLELPLHYAYFLLPFGIVLGSLDAKAGLLSRLALHRAWLQVLLGLGLLAVLLTARDYLRIEASSYALRFEDRGIRTDRPFEPPQVTVLDQFSGYFELVRMKPTAGLSDAALQGMRDAVNTTPSARSMFNLAGNLALNGRPDEARLWLVTLCKTMGQENCAEARERWTVAGYPQATGMDWPLP